MALSQPFIKFVTLPYDTLAAMRESSRTELVRSVIADSRSRVLKLVKTAATSINTTIAEVRRVVIASPPCSGTLRRAG